MWELIRRRSERNTSQSTSPRFCEIIDHRDVERIYSRMEDKAIIITRKPPRREKETYFWISKVEHPKAIHPSQLYIIEENVRKHLQKSRNNEVVIFDAFEYIKIEQGSESAYKFVGKLRDLTILSGSKFIVSISDALDEKEKALLKRIIED
ncbi:DUF835 domain-containing protein [Palaeococcus sp. (in: euryarchaeotes)]